MKNAATSRALLGALLLGFVLPPASAWALSSAEPPAETARSSDPCAPAWRPAIGELPGTNGPVHVLKSFDDGTGLQLYIGGSFPMAGGAVTNNIARFDGERWSPLGAGMDRQVSALAVYDDGAGGGDALCAAGDFDFAGEVAAQRIARWNGTSWESLGPGCNAIVNDLLVHDDGTGSKLYAAGQFTTAGGVAANGVAVWDGTSWSTLGTGLTGVTGQGWALAEFDDGTGPALFVGGAFDTAGGVPASRIAKWDGSTWSALGAGVDARVLSLAVHDDGTGPALFAGGSFELAGGQPATSIAKWDGSAWAPVGGGFAYNDSTQPVYPGDVYGLTSYDDGSGLALFATGNLYAEVGGAGPLLNNVARWDGAAWSTLAGGLSLVGRAFEAFDDGSGSRLYIGGDFKEADGLFVRRLGSWDGAEWRGVGPGLGGPGSKGSALGERVRQLEVYDDGTGHGPELYVAGTFDVSGGLPSLPLVKWDGKRTAPLGASTLGISTRAMQTHDDGSGAGPRLFIGGSVDTGSAYLSGVLAWDGQSWSQIGSISTPDAMASFDDGTGAGPELYIGDVGMIDGTPVATRVAKWDGTSWSPLPTAGQPVDIKAMLAHDDGAGGGTALYVADVTGVVRWDGTAWTRLATVTGPVSPQVSVFGVFDSGTGPELYAGGRFVTIEGIAAEGIARWDGVGWAPVGAGVTSTQAWTGVDALRVFDDGAGAQLYVGGSFEDAGGLAVESLARWDGSAWSDFGFFGNEALMPPNGGYGGIVPTTTVYAFATYDDGSGAGPSLFVGGTFITSPAGDSHVAQYGGCSDALSYCTAGTSASGCQALLSATGVPSASALSGFVVSAATVEGAKDGMLIYGTNGRQANTWGNGSSLVCVMGPRLRGGLLFGSGTQGACDGSFAQDLNARWCSTCPKPAHNPGAGAVMQAQLWYRDPQNTSNQTSSLSDAIEFVFSP